MQLYKIFCLKFDRCYCCIIYGRELKLLSLKNCWSLFCNMCIRKLFQLLNIIVEYLIGNRNIFIIVILYYYISKKCIYY